MKPWHKLLLQSVAELVALVTLHAILIRVLVQTNAVSAIFAAGDHLPFASAAVAVAFIVIRLLTVLALPGMILVRLGFILWAAIAERDRVPASPNRIDTKATVHDQ
ncbi:MAG: hypothetical protein O3B24_00485 [Verrucomicrobia bacterium]|nr:hypothetical protein [Verrucomicrobiota bacterium]